MYARQATPAWKSNRRTAVRETGVSLKSCALNLGHPLKPLRPSDHYHIGGFKGPLNRSPIMPRHASFLNKRC